MTQQNENKKYWGNSYGYDARGNLLQKSITKCGAENLIVTADAHNWIHASGTDYQYDAAGNMTFDATAGLGYKGVKAVKEVLDAEPQINEKK